LPFCPNCGKEVSEDTKFCPQCGRQLMVEIGSEATETGTEGFETTAMTDWTTNTEEVMEALGIEVEATPEQIERIHAIASNKAYITPKGKMKPQYRRLAKAITGKTSAENMTKKEAERFIDALQQIPSPTAKSVTSLRTLIIEATVGAIILTIPVASFSDVGIPIVGIFGLIWVALLPIFFGINEVLDTLRGKWRMELKFKKPTVEEAKFEIAYDISHGADTILANYYETEQQQASDTILDGKEQESYDLKISDGYWTRSLFGWKYHEDLLSIPKARIIRVVQRKY